MAGILMRVGRFLFAPYRTKRLRRKQSSEKYRTVGHLSTDTNETYAQLRQEVLDELTKSLKPIHEHIRQQVAINELDKLRANPPQPNPVRTSVPLPTIPMWVVENNDGLKVLCSSANRPRVDYFTNVKRVVAGPYGSMADATSALQLLNQVEGSATSMLGAFAQSFGLQSARGMGNVSTLMQEFNELKKRGETKQCPGSQNSGTSSPSSNTDQPK